MKLKLTEKMSWLDVALAAVEACREQGETDHKAAVEYILKWMENDPEGFARLEEEACWKFLTDQVEDAHAMLRRSIERGNGRRYKEQTKPRARGTSQSPAQKELNKYRNRWLLWQINGDLLGNLDGPMMLERAQHARSAGAGQLRTAIFLEKVAAKVKGRKLKDSPIAKNEDWFDKTYEEAKAESLETAGIVGYSTDET